MSPTLLSPAHLARDLSTRDLTDPAQGHHALQLLVDDLVDALHARWGCAIAVVRRHPIVSIDDNYDRLLYESGAVARDVRYTRYVSETCVLRSHTSAGVPSALRDLAAAVDSPTDTVIACPGMVYRRDVIDRLHTGTPHQVDLWRVTATEMTAADLEDMIATVVTAALPGVAWRTLPAVHPYTLEGREIEVEATGGTWVEVGECGLAHPGVLAGAGLGRSRGLAMGLGLDRLLMVRKGIPDIRLLRSLDPRVEEQMHDLLPYRPVSAQPSVRRDLSVAVADALPVDGEAIGDRVRDALGPDAGAVEEVTVLSDTPYADVPPQAVERLGMRPGQRNLLVRVVLRSVDRTLTDAEANELRDRIYAALHEGANAQWAARN